jgi:hypothetical protein
VVHDQVESISLTHAFDGIWCQASLLHLPKKKLTHVFTKLLNALKVQGIWYLSFKHGEGNSMREAEGRYFQDFTIPSFREFIAPFSNVEILDLQVRSPSREGATVDWLTATLKKLA